MNKLTLLVSVLLSGTLTAGLNIDNNKITGYKLQLDEELYLSNQQGVVNPAQFVKAELGRHVRIYRTDGVYYTGVINEIEEAAAWLKVYGVIDNVKNTRFGFVLAKDGVFAGAVIEQDEDKVYALDYSSEAKGYVLLRTFKYDKPKA